MAGHPFVVQQTETEDRIGGDVRLDLTGVLADEIGHQHGLTQLDWKGIEPDLERAAVDLRDRRVAGDLEVLDLPYRRQELSRIRELAGECRSVDNFIVLGIGGSALGARALYEACLPAQYNLLPRDRRGAPRLFVAENVDPESLAALFEIAPPERSIYNVISKSGTTIETIAQFLVVWEQLRASLGASFQDRVIVTTDPDRGFLRRLASDRGLRSLTVPTRVGGRYSVLSAVGLLPAAVAGIEPEALLAGAERMDERCRSLDWRENPALALAAVHVQMDRSKGKSVAVMVPYSDALRSFAEWFCQLWGESLGKRSTPSGEARSPVGQTPVRAVGATDQHSQLQLWVEGPNDKLITFVAVASPRAEIVIPATSLAELEDDRLGHISGHGIGELLSLERSATELVLAGAERPVLVLDVPCLGADAMGQMLYLYEWAAIAAGILYHVNPFDQPGVEEGKELTHAAMGRVGLEDLRDRVQAHRSRTDRFRV